MFVFWALSLRIYGLLSGANPQVRPETTHNGEFSQFCIEFTFLDLDFRFYFCCII